jgi:transcriptional regulator with XRE-family HTH domain
VTLIRITGSQLHAARVLVGLSREEVAERAGLCRHSIRKWGTSSDAVPAATYSHLCRAVDVLENEGARFCGGQPIIRRHTRLSNRSGTPSINSNDSKGLHLAARARHAGVSHARHEQEPQSARVLQWFAARLRSDKHFRSFSAR